MRGISFRLASAGPVSEVPVFARSTTRKRRRKIRRGFAARARNRTHGIEQPTHRRRRSRRRRAQEPLAGAPRPRPERDRPRPRAVHVGPHVLRVVDPHQQRRDVDDHQVLRRVFLLRPVLPGHGLVRRRGRDRADRRARVSRRAQVPDQLPPVHDLPRPHEDDAARGHDALVLAGVHRLRAVLPRGAARLHHADASRS